jgi:magnesium chelatase family protein
MDLSVVYSRALAGINAPEVCVETHLSNGLPAFNIVGLPETAVRESKDRVRSAILNSHFTFPDRRITVNLAPADLPKEGGRFDLPIALGILGASGQVPTELFQHHEFLGELALDGAIRPVPGVVCASSSAQKEERCLVIDSQSAPQAALVPDSEVIGAEDLLTLCAHLNGNEKLEAAQASLSRESLSYPDLREVQGQHTARRALEIAASGSHSLLLSGPPGAGKTLLASRLPGILPPLGINEALESLALRDIQGLGPDLARLQQRPFRSPHHSASPAALVGGGSKPVPGEISLAHGGVLFLDELPEFNRHSLEMLREPLESGEITLSRAQHKLTYPARFQLIAAMNPCPCGYLGDPERNCRCSPDQILRYRGRLSGPFLDRIDMHIRVNRLPAGQLLRPQQSEEPSAAVRERVIQCQALQQQRHGSSNARLSTDAIKRVCALGQRETAYLEEAAERLHLSGRGLHRTLKVARTIADMGRSEEILQAHIAEALAYREATQP